MNWIKKHKLLTVVLALVALMVIASAGGSDKSASTSQTAPAQATQATTAAPAPAPKPPKPTLDEFYAKLTNGQSKAEVDALAGRDSGSCSEMQMEYTGTIVTCTYGGFTDSGMVMVQFTDDKLSTKSINRF